MNTLNPKFITAASVAATLDLDTKPERWPAGAPFELLDMRPGRVLLIGAPPATGKSTLALQLVSSILSNTLELRAVVGNIEMPPAALVEKLLTRFAGVTIDALQDRELLADERARVEAAKRNNSPLLERIAFLEPPFTLRHLGETMQDFGARLALIDYAQRFTTGEGDGDDRMKLDTLMSRVRLLANAGAGIILISSVARQKSKNGSSTYAGLNLASFRGSSEIEFGADSAYILETDSETGVALLKDEKQRFRVRKDIHLRFDGARQTFTAGEPLDQFDAAKGKGKKP